MVLLFKNMTYRSLDSVSVFRWNILRGALQKELLCLRAQEQKLIDFQHSDPCSWFCLTCAGSPPFFQNISHSATKSYVCLRAANLP
jgi:hypothetical protein